MKVRGVETREAQYWANLLELDELFPGIASETVSQLAKAIAAGWRQALVDQFPHSAEVVSVIVDDEEEENLVALWDGVWAG